MRSPVWKSSKLDTRIPHLKTGPDLGHLVPDTDGACRCRRGSTSLRRTTRALPLMMRPLRTMQPATRPPLDRSKICPDLGGAECDFLELGIEQSGHRGPDFVDAFVDDFVLFDLDSFAFGGGGNPVVEAGMEPDDDALGGGGEEHVALGRGAPAPATSTISRLTLVLSIFLSASTMASTEPWVSPLTMSLRMLADCCSMTLKKLSSVTRGPRPAACWLEFAFLGEIPGGLCSRPR